MIQQILLCTDFSECSRAAYDTATALAREYGATVHLVHRAEAVPPFYYEQVSADYPIERYWTTLERKLEEESRLPVFAGIPIEAELLYEGASYDRLLPYAKDRGMDLIILATHGHTGLGHVFLGSFAERIVRYSPVPVLTHRRKPDHASPFAARTVLVPFDFSDNAKAVLPLVESFAHKVSPKFIFVDVEPLMQHGLYHAPANEPPPYEDLKIVMSQSAARHRLDFEQTIRKRLPDAKAVFESREGTPYWEIVQSAKEHEADLILMATHGRTGFKHFLLGSVAEKVVRLAPCSVLTIRPAGLDESPGESKPSQEPAHLFD